MPESGRQIDPFSRQVQRITRSRLIEGVYPFVGDTVGVNLVSHNTVQLDRIAARLGRELHPSSSSHISDEMHQKLWGSLLLIRSGSAIIKEMSGEGKSLREVAAAERNDTRPRLKDQRQAKLRKQFTSVIEGVFSEGHTSEDMVAVAIVTAMALVTADQEDIELAASQLGWLKYQAEKTAESQPEYAVVAHMTEGMLDIVNPLLDKTEVLAAA